MSLFRLVAKIGIDASEFNTGLKQAESGVSSSMAAIGSKIAAAFSTAAIIEFSRRVVQAAGDVNDLADQFGESVENIQAMQVAAKEAGIEWGTYASILAKVKKAQADVTAGDPKAKELFDRLGLTANQPVFSVLQQLGNEQDTAAVIDLIGVKSQKAINSLRELKDLGEREMFSKETAERFDTFGASIESIAREYSAMAANAVNWVFKIGDAWALNIEFQKRYNEELKNMGFKNPYSAQLSGQVEMLTGGPNWKRITDDIIREAQEKSSRSLVGGRPNRAFARESGDVYGPPESPIPKNVMPDGFTMSGRSSDLVGPLRAKEKFSAVSFGDRANVGGFFGPNADVNNRMASELAKISKSIDSIDAKLVQAMTTP